jgi:hypothetical protein
MRSYVVIVLLANFESSCWEIDWCPLEVAALYFEGYPGGLYLSPKPVHEPLMGLAQDWSVYVPAAEADQERSYSVPGFVVCAH